MHLNDSFGQRYHPNVTNRNFYYALNFRANSDTNFSHRLKYLLDGTSTLAAAQCRLIWRSLLNLTFFS